MNRKVKINTEIIIAGVLSLLGIYGIIESIQLGLWDEVSPSTGFMPFLSSIIMLAFSVIWLANSLRSAAKPAADAKEGESDTNLDKNEVKWAFGVPGLMLIAVLSMNFIGTHVALAILLLVFFRFISKFAWKKTLVLTALLSVIFYLIFTVWLGVPFPKFFGLI